MQSWHRDRQPKEKTIWINTTKYSTLFRRIFEEYGPRSQIRIDGQTYTEADADDLVSKWCTNRKIKSTHNFELSTRGRVLFSFHDGPEHLWTAYSELAFIEQLRQEHIVRYEVVPEH